MVLPKDDYDGPILPAQRWRSRGSSGHPLETITVLRVNERSVQIVVEGGGKRRGAAHRPGRKYGIGHDAFRQNFVLVSQPPGYTPEPTVEAPPAPPKRDVVGDYFRRRRWVENTLQQLQGEDPRELFRATIYTDDPNDPILLLNTPPSTPPAPPAQPTVEEEPMDAASVPVDEPAPALVPEPDDPFEVFLNTGKALVERLTAEIMTLGAERDLLKAKVETLEAQIQVKEVRRNRIEQGVLAAVASATDAPAEAHEVPDAVHTASVAPPAPEIEPLGSQPVEPIGAQPVESLYPEPDLTQSEWVRRRLVQDKRMHVGSVADEFGSRFGVSRESAIKNISSLLGTQVNHPVATWPSIERVGKGTYQVVVG